VGDTVGITIDGRVVSVPAGVSIMDACDAAGIYVPRLCAYPGLKPVGDCGLCFVRASAARSADGGSVDGGLSDAGSAGGGPADGGDVRRACSVAVQNGMSVSTTDAEALTYRRNSTAAILGDHPHVCLTCPARDGCSRDECTYGNVVQARCCGEFNRCEIAKVAAFVGVLEQASGYQFRALGQTVDHQIRSDLDLCIGCGRCVVACDTLEEAGEALKMVETATLVGRDPGGAEYLAAEAARTAGEGMESVSADWKPRSYLGRAVAVPKAEDLRASGCTFCGVCVMVCPSGALSASGAKGAAWLAKRRERTTLSLSVLPPEARLTFTADVVADVAAREGVFVLYGSAGDTLQISGVRDLRAGLTEALSDSTTRGAAFFTYEEEPMYTQRESEMLARHLQEHGEMPRRNDGPDALFDGDGEFV